MKQGIRTYLDGGGQEQVGIPTSSSSSSSSTTSSNTTSNTNTVHDPDAEDNRKKGPREIQAIFVGTRRDDPHGPQLSPRSWTDKDWPRVERIHPILDWTYQDVWKFLRCPHLASSSSSTPPAKHQAGVVGGMTREELAQKWGVAGGGDQGVPYCLLYDQGYTSLGSTFNTLPNPELKIPPPSTSQDNAQGEGEGKAGEDACVVVGDGTAKGRWKPAYMLKDGSLERAGRVESPSPSSSASVQQQ